MITRMYLGLLLLGQLLSALALTAVPANAAVGVYNFSATSAGGLPITVTYRLNSPGEVSIQFRNASDSLVASLGPYSETAGVHSHNWDKSGLSLPAGNYRARITATQSADTNPTGTLIPMWPDGPAISGIYGLAIDRYAQSPAYGTIYVGRALGGGGELFAFYPDGTPKNWDSANATGNDLHLGLNLLPATVPWGIGVDRNGDIYIACTAGFDTAGAWVYDYHGNRLSYVLQTDPSGIVWLDGLWTAAGPEIYETKGSTVRYSVLSGTAWTTAMDPGVVGSSIRTTGICFETGGSACYVGTSGTASDPLNPNPGLHRFVRQADGSWSKDTSFVTELAGMYTGSQRATRYVQGVSCDARDPDGAGPYTASVLWVGLATNNSGSNVARVALPGGATTLFQSGVGQTRFVASDAVGNVAIEYGPAANNPQLWSDWGMRYPGGEASSDSRLTNWVSIAGAAQRKIVSSIGQLKQEETDTEVELATSYRVSAVFTDCFYIEESDRSHGIKVKCNTAVHEGDLVRVAGELSIEQGERYLSDAEILIP